MKDELLTPAIEDNDDGMLYDGVHLVERLNKMNTPINKLLLLLDDYYGNSRNMGHKKEICDFIETYAEEIQQITEEYLK